MTPHDRRDISMSSAPIKSEARKAELQKKAGLQIDALPKCKPRPKGGKGKGTYKGQFKPWCK